MRAIEGFVELESEHAEGVTKRKFYQTISAFKDTQEKLDSDKVSDRASYLWGWFWEIKSASANGMSNAITWSVLRDWSEMMGVTLKEWEARTLVLMDAKMRVTTEKFKPKKTTPTKDR